MEHAILTGDLVDILPDLESNIFDGVLSDPPYGIGFMGKAWDAALPSDRILSELLRVLKPGGHAVFFGSPRTHHRLMVALEDAGFEIRDVCMWIYGQGFPKSRNVSLDLDAATGYTPKIVGSQKLSGTARTAGGRAGTGSEQLAKDEIALKRATSPAVSFGTATARRLNRRGSPRSSYVNRWRERSHRTLRNGERARSM